MPTKCTPLGIRGKRNVYLWEVNTAKSRDFTSTLNSVTKEFCDALGSHLNSLAPVYSDVKKKIKPVVSKPDCTSESYEDELKIFTPRHNSRQTELKYMGSRTLQSVYNQISVKASVTCTSSRSPAL